MPKSCSPSPFDTPDRPSETSTRAASAPAKGARPTAPKDCSGSGRVQVRPASWPSQSRGGRAFPAWIFTPPEAGTETPAPSWSSLCAMSRPPTRRAGGSSGIIRHVEERFHLRQWRDVGLGDDLAASAGASCGMHAGTCVGHPQLRRCGLSRRGDPCRLCQRAYFPEGAEVSAPGHCWMALDVSECAQPMGRVDSSNINSGRSPRRRTRSQASASPMLSGVT